MAGYQSPVMGALTQGGQMANQGMSVANSMMMGVQKAMNSTSDLTLKLTTMLKEEEARKFEQGMQMTQTLQNDYQFGVNKKIAEEKNRIMQQNANTSVVNANTAAGNATIAREKWDLEEPLLTAKTNALVKAYENYGNDTFELTPPNLDPLKQQMDVLSSQAAKIDDQEFDMYLDDKMTEEQYDQNAEDRDAYLKSYKDVGTKKLTDNHNEYSRYNFLKSQKIKADALGLPFEHTLEYLPLESKYAAQAAEATEAMKAKYKVKSVTNPKYLKAAESIFPSTSDNYDVNAGVKRAMWADLRTKGSGIADATKTVMDMFPTGTTSSQSVAITGNKAAAVKLDIKSTNERIKDIEKNIQAQSQLGTQTGDANVLLLKDTLKQVRKRRDGLTASISSKGVPSYLGDGSKTLLSQDYEPKDATNILPVEENIMKLDREVSISDTVYYPDTVVGKDNYYKQVSKQYKNSNAMKRLLVDNLDVRNSTSVVDGVIGAVMNDLKNLGLSPSATNFMSQFNKKYRDPYERREISSYPQQVKFDVGLGFNEPAGSPKRTQSMMNIIGSMRKSSSKAGNTYSTAFNMYYNELGGDDLVEKDKQQKLIDNSIYKSIIDSYSSGASFDSSSLVSNMPDQLFKNIFGMSKSNLKAGIENNKSLGGYMASQHMGVIKNMAYDSNYVTLFDGDSFDKTKAASGNMFRGWLESGVTPKILDTTFEVLGKYNEKNNEWFGSWGDDDIGESLDDSKLELPLYGKEGTVNASSFFESSTPGANSKDATRLSTNVQRMFKAVGNNKDLQRQEITQNYVENAPNIPVTLLDDKGDNISVMMPLSYIYGTITNYIGMTLTN